MQSAEPEDLPSTQAKRHIDELAGGKMRDRENLLVCRLAPDGLRGERLGRAHHRHHQLIARGFPSARGRDRGPVAHDRDSVGDGENLIHSMRNKDGRTALRLERPDVIEDDFHLVPIERRRGFVENDDPRWTREHLQNLDDLPLVGGKFAHHGFGLDAAAQRLAESRKESRRRFTHRGAVHKSI